MSQYYILTPLRMGYMARMSRGKRKYQWMQTKMEYQLSASASSSPHADSFYIDVAMGLSLLNRKLIRQGQLFRIKGMRVYQTGDTNSRRFKVATIPTNWVARNAFVKGKALWDEMNLMASQSVGSTSMFPKYHDYKVYMNAAHKSNYATGDDQQIPLPCDADGNEVVTTGSEWIYSKYADSGAASDNYDVKFLGDHDGSYGASGGYTCVSLIKAYGESRVKPQAQDPLLPDDFEESPWALLFGDDDQTHDALEALEGDNNAPPYPPAVYVGSGDDHGGFVVGTGSVAKTSASALTTVQAFTAPCGLIRVEIDDDSSMSNEPIHISFDVEILGPMDM